MIDDYTQCAVPIGACPQPDCMRGMWRRIGIHPAMSFADFSTDIRPHGECWAYIAPAGSKDDTERVRNGRKEQG